MARTLNPYLNLTDGRAREALEFYQSVLGGQVDAQTFGEGGMEGPFADLVMHGQLTTPQGLTLMVSDSPAEMVAVTHGTNVSVAVTGGGEDADDLRAQFAGLSTGGEVTEPLVVAPWGDEFGTVVDKFGFNWLFNIAGAPPA